MRFITQESFELLSQRTMDQVSKVPSFSKSTDFTSTDTFRSGGHDSTKNMRREELWQDQYALVDAIRPGRPTWHSPKRTRLRESSRWRHYPKLKRLFILHRSRLVTSERERKRQSTRAQCRIRILDPLLLFNHPTHYE